MSSCKLVIALALAVAAPGVISVAQDSDPIVDSVRDSIPPDSLVDSLSVLSAGSLQDKLKAKAGVTAVARPKEPAIIPVSYFDSSLAWLGLSRLNLRPMIDRGAYRSAADYARFDQLYLPLDYSDIPMRAVVRPFGLPGARLGVLKDGVSLSPFEHTPEPDGTIDLYDIPTALDDGVYFLPSGTGMLLGGTPASATLVTQATRPSDNDAHSAFLVRKGELGYSHARARYVRRFKQGRRVNLSLDYRRAETGFNRGREDSYTYAGGVYLPLTRQWAAEFDGYLYRRSANYQTRPDSGGFAVDRNRSDRQLLASLVRHNRAGTVRTALGYEYVRQQSNLDRGADVIKGRFALDTRGGFLERHWAGPNYVMQARINAVRRLWSDGAFDFREFSSAVRWSLVRKLAHGAYGLTLGGIAVERFDPSPVGALAWSRETPNSFIHFTAAYGERQPTLHERHLQRRRTSLYGQPLDYGEEGTPTLTPERQVTAAVVTDWGKETGAFRLSVAAGRIFDALNWLGEIDVDTAPLATYHRFRPINSGIEYFSIAGGPRFSFGQTLYLTGGAGYNYVTFDTLPDRPYQPTYRLFAASELHWYWKPKLIHLRGYAEVNWIGRFHGYDQYGMGEELVVNTKVSFQMNRFRFYVAHENLFGPNSQVREAFDKLYRIFSYGFEWQFLN